jgi:inner membrane protein
MPTVISHAVAAGALITAFPKEVVPRRWALPGAVYSMVPDLDVLGFRFGIHYGDFLGHRGFTHSLLFAAGLAFLTMFAAPRRHRALVCLYLFLATASHGILDALTDGGMGVAFFSPIDLTRYFFPITPIEVSPIGARFFSPRGLAVIQSELLWIWIPSVLFAAAALLLHRVLRQSVATNPSSGQ